MLQDRWKQEYRLTFVQFFALLELLKPFIQKNTHFMNAIPANKVLTIVFNRLAFDRVVQKTKSYLGLGATTTSKYTHLVSEILVWHFYDKYIKIPDG